jgi:hypothetical protein
MLHIVIINISLYSFTYFKRLVYFPRNKKKNKQQLIAPKKGPTSIYNPETKRWVLVNIIEHKYWVQDPGPEDFETDEDYLAYQMAHN